MISYGSQQRSAEMPCDNRSHQLGEGHQCGAEMPTWTHPPRLVLESQGSNAEMPMRDRSQGKGQGVYAERSILIHPSQPVFGSRNHNAAMPMEKRSHLFTRGHHNNASERSPLKGRVNYPSQECHKENTLPNQFTEKIMGRAQQCHSRLIFSKGRVIMDTQKCHVWAALPNQFTGVKITPQRCHSARTPTSFGPHSRRSNAN